VFVYQASVYFLREGYCCTRRDDKGRVTGLDVNVGFMLYDAPPAYLTISQMRLEEVCSLKALELNCTPTALTLSMSSHKTYRGILNLL